MKEKETKATKRSADYTEAALKNFKELQRLANKRTSDYVCKSCGTRYLNWRQRILAKSGKPFSQGGWTIIYSQVNNCGICGNACSLAHIRHFNHLNIN